MHLNTQDETTNQDIQLTPKAADVEVDNQVDPIKQPDAFADGFDKLVKLSNRLDDILKRSHAAREASNEISTSTVRTQIEESSGENIKDDTDTNASPIKAQKIMGSTADSVNETANISVQPQEQELHIPKDVSESPSAAKNITENKTSNTIKTLDELISEIIVDDKVKQDIADETNEKLKEIFANLKPMPVSDVFMKEKPDIEESNTDIETQKADIEEQKTDIVEETATAIPEEIIDTSDIYVDTGFTEKDTQDYFNEEKIDTDDGYVPLDEIDRRNALFNDIANNVKENDNANSFFNGKQAPNIPERYFPFSFEVDDREESVVFEGRDSESNASEPDIQSYYDEGKTDKIPVVAFEEIYPEKIEEIKHIKELFADESVDVFQITDNSTFSENESIEQSEEIKYDFYSEPKADESYNPYYYAQNESEQDYVANNDNNEYEEYAAYDEYGEYGDENLSDGELPDDDEYGRFYDDVIADEYLLEPENETDPYQDENYVSYESPNAGMLTQTYMKRENKKKKKSKKNKKEDSLVQFDKPTRKLSTGKIALISMIVLLVGIVCSICGSIISSLPLSIAGVIIIILGVACYFILIKQYKKIPDGQYQQELYDDLEKYKFDLAETLQGYDLAYTQEDLDKAADAYRAQIADESYQS